MGVVLLQVRGGALAHALVDELLVVVVDELAHEGGVKQFLEVVRGCRVFLMTTVVFKPSLAIGLPVSLLLLLLLVLLLL